MKALQTPEIVLDYFAWELEYKEDNIHHKVVLIALDEQEVEKDLKRWCRVKPYKIISIKKLSDVPVTYQSKSYWRMITRFIGSR